MAYDPLEVVSVDAHGNATANFDRVNFQLTSDVYDKTPAAVKLNLQKLAEQFKKVLADIASDSSVVIDEGMTSTTSSVHKHHEYDHKKHVNVEKGYHGIYQVRFESSTPAEAATIYDKLLNLDGFTVGAPNFRLKHQENLKLTALKDAWNRLTERFKAECAVVGVDPEQYRVITWHVDYQGQTGVAAASNYANSKMATVALAASLGPEDDGELIAASKAIVTVYLTATFARKYN